MSERVIEADYVIVGAGACAMAFADELLTHSQSSIAMVDRRDSPGGHWNDAYPFVRLHQPSEFYGVNSRELGQHVKYTSGPNKGLYNLASGSEVLAYFDRLMQQRFLPSGREVELDVPPGTTLLDAAIAAGLPIARSCGAEGVCAKCALRIVDGAERLSPEAPDETRIKSRNRVDAELRLACRAEIRGDVTATASYW